MKTATLIPFRFWLLVVCLILCTVRRAQMEPSAFADALTFTLMLCWGGVFMILGVVFLFERR